MHVRPPMSALQELRLERTLRLECEEKAVRGMQWGRELEKEKAKRMQVCVCGGITGCVDDACMHLFIAIYACPAYREFPFIWSHIQTNTQYR